MPESFHYKELVTNFLDLLAFLLVTPELVRYVNPALKTGVQKLIFLLVCYVLVIPFAAFTEWLRVTGRVVVKEHDMASLGWLMLFAGIFMGLMFLGCYLVLTRYKKQVEGMSDAVAQKAFLIGLALFVAARLIASGYSLWELLST
jgi:hypothetical protein